MPAAAPTPPVRALLRRLVDYAGLFPPAALSMSQAAAQYAAHLRSKEGWILARFVVPVDRLDELASAAGSLFDEASEPWRVSVLISDDPASAGARIRAFNAAHRGRLVVDVAECPPIPAGSVARTVGVLPGELRSFVELQVLDDPRPMLEEISAAGAWAKMRTGGTSAGAFPTSRQVARLVARATEVGVPFKATAGLHHPITGEYPLTYAPDSPRAPMFGFLNLFAASVLAQRGATEATLIDLLDERDADAIAVDDEWLSWNGLSANASEIANARTSLAISFGSCSIAEPVDGLRSLRLL